MSKNSPQYGGQAIIEGVMFGGKKHTVSAIRRMDETVEYFEYEKAPKDWATKLKKIPLLRGNVALFESLGIGARHLNFSADAYEEDFTPEEEKAKEKEPPSRLAMALGIAAIAIISFLFGKVIFTLIPIFVAELFSSVVPSKSGQILLEGLFKFLMLLGYMYLISFMPMIRRVFQYHGAEHKVINTYEKGLPLTVENVQANSRLHTRCGSSFILFTVLIGLVIYMFFPTDPLWLRVVNRLALIPVVLGVSYEFLQLTTKLQANPIFGALAKPGLYLQKITTKEPDDSQVEVAIASFSRLMELENGKDNKERIVM